MQSVSEEIEKRKPTFTSLQDSAPKHTEGEDPEVQDVQKQYKCLDKAWTNLSDEVGFLYGTTEPWKELTDRFDELSLFVSDMGSQVNRDEESTKHWDETEGGDLSDIIVNFKVLGRMI